MDANGVRNALFATAFHHCPSSRRRIIAEECAGRSSSCCKRETVWSPATPLVLPAIGAKVLGLCASRPSSEHTGGSRPSLWYAFRDGEGDAGVAGEPGPEGGEDRTSRGALRLRIRVRKPVRPPPPEGGAGEGGHEAPPVLRGARADVRRAGALPGRAAGPPAPGRGGRAGTDDGGGEAASFRGGAGARRAGAGQHARTPVPVLRGDARSDQSFHAGPSGCVARGAASARGRGAYGGAPGPAGDASGRGSHAPQAP